MAALNRMLSPEELHQINLRGGGYPREDFQHSYDLVVTRFKFAGIDPEEVSLEALFHKRSYSLKMNFKYFPGNSRFAFVLYELANGNFGFSLVDKLGNQRYDYSLDKYNKYKIKQLLDTFQISAFKKNKKARLVRVMDGEDIKNINQITERPGLFSDSVKLTVLLDDAAVLAKRYGKTPAQGSTGDTDLILAVKANLKAEVEKLASQNRNLEAVNHQGKNALTIAAESGFDECLQILINLNAETGLKNISYNARYFDKRLVAIDSATACNNLLRAAPALIGAILNNKYKCARLLLLSGCDINFLNYLVREINSLKDDFNFEQDSKVKHAKNLLKILSFVLSNGLLEGHEFPDIRREIIWKFLDRCEEQDIAGDNGELILSEAVLWMMSRDYGAAMDQLRSLQSSRCEAHRLQAEYYEKKGSFRLAILHYHAASQANDLLAEIKLKRLVELLRDTVDGCDIVATNCKVTPEVACSYSDFKTRYTYLLIQDKVYLANKIKHSFVEVDYPEVLQRSSGMKELMANKEEVLNVAENPLKQICQDIEARMKELRSSGLNWRSPENKLEVFEKLKNALLDLQANQCAEKYSDQKTIGGFINAFLDLESIGSQTARGILQENLGLPLVAGRFWLPERNIPASQMFVEGLIKTYRDVELPRDLHIIPEARKLVCL